MKDFENFAQLYSQSVIESNPQLKEAQDLIATAAVFGHQVAERPWEHGREPFDFGTAINALKTGAKVRRRGWNGRGMFLWLKPATTVKAEWCHDPMLKELAVQNGGEIPALGTICMYTAQGEILTGWLASQTDILSEDWEVVTMRPA